MPALHVDRRKVVTIPHGATTPDAAASKRRRQTHPVDLGSAWARERASRGSSARWPRSRTFPVGRATWSPGSTHPKVRAADGEAYRNARIEQARRGGLADSVSFDPAYRDVASLTALVQSASVVVLPYDSTDQVTSGVLVDAVASGRPVVATAFPHAVELLGSGAGIVVDHDDPDALTSGAAPGAHRCHVWPARWPQRPVGLAPTMAWPVVANSYVRLARRVLAERPALV